MLMLFVAKDIKPSSVRAIRTSGRRMVRIISSEGGWSLPSRSRGS